MPLLILVKTGVYAVMALSLAAGVGVVTRPNLFHSALCLVVALLGVAALYIALRAEFIAVVQILLYVGAVMTVLIFAIMLTQRMGNQTIPQTNTQSIPAFLALLAFASLVSFFLLKNVGGAALPQKSIGAFELGQALLGEYVFPFEVVSVILIAALIGAIVIARRD